MSMTKISKEDFEAWRANAVTEMVMETARERAEDVRQSWLGLLDEEPSADLLEQLPNHFLRMQAEYKLFTELPQLEPRDLEDEDEADDDDIGARGDDGS